MVNSWFISMLNRVHFGIANKSVLAFYNWTVKLK